MLSWRAWTGILLLMVVGVTWWSDRTTRVGGPSITMNSVLLDWDLPGTLPHPDLWAATARLQEAAKRQQSTCGEIEVYRVTDAALLAATLEGAQAERHYLRFKDRKDLSLSRWEGPNRLLMLEGKGELLLCALDWPMSG